MKNPIRPSDVSLIAALVVPISQKIPAHLVTADETYLDMVGKVPNWFFWFSLGFAVAVWIFESIKDGSRVRQFWDWLTKKFEVDRIYFETPIKMPQTDVEARLRIRFRRSGNYRLNLRIYQCTGMGREPLFQLIKLGQRRFEKDEVLVIPLVDMGIPEPGWDHKKQRGWGPNKEGSFIGGSSNVVVLECSGSWLTQRHRFYVSMVNHDRGLHKFKPSVFVLDEKHDIWDTTPDVVSNGGTNG